MVSISIKEGHMKACIIINVILVAILSGGGMQLEAQTAATHMERRAERNQRDEPIDPILIESRLELFVDNYLIQDMKGGAEVVLHHPTPQEVVMVHDEP